LPGGTAVRCFAAGRIAGESKRYADPDGSEPGETVAEADRGERPRAVRRIGFANRFLGR
jgi:hypothetical protein